MAQASWPLASTPLIACTSVLAHWLLSRHCSLQILLYHHKCIQKRSPVTRSWGILISERCILPKHTLLEIRTAVLCAGRWIPPTCGLRERADVLFSSCSVRARYQIEGGVKGDDGLLIMRAGASYYYESARTLLSSGRQSSRCAEDQIKI